ncbi:MAG: gamma carbonic anhydrase family protein [Burkholderiales bacterium]
MLEHNSSVWFNSVIRGDNDMITIGENSQVQDGSVLHTDMGYPLTLGKNVSVGHMSMLHGCTVGDGKIIPDGSMVLGSPGRVLRQLSPQGNHQGQQLRRPLRAKIQALSVRVQTRGMNARTARPRNPEQ